MEENVHEVLRTLNDRERAVIELRYGINNRVPLTLEQVGKMFNVTRERARQIEAQAIRRIRHPSRSEKLTEYARNTKK